MTLGLNNQRRRARRRVWLGLAKFGIMLALVGAVAGFFFMVGARHADSEIERREARLAQLSAESDRLKSAAAEAAAAKAHALADLKAMQDRYARDVPTGPVRDLLPVVKEKLDQGLDPTRLALVLKTMALQRACDTDPVIKRFLVPTPLANAPAQVTFGANAVVVSANGTAATSASGAPEAWFDPAKPVTVRYALSTGTSEEAAGNLPIDHSLVAGGSEYHITVANGTTRGMVVVTAERCDYP
jgi:hypothetical protein